MRLCQMVQVVAVAMYNVSKLIQCDTSSGRHAVEHLGEKQRRWWYRMNRQHGWIVGIKTLFFSFRGEGRVVVYWKLLLLLIVELFLVFSQFFRHGLQIVQTDALILVHIKQSKDFLYVVLFVFGFVRLVREWGPCCRQERQEFRTCHSFPGTFIVVVVIVAVRHGGILLVERLE